jgi:hypothetical protein
VSVVGPRAFAHTGAKRDAFVDMIRDGDLFVTTGWDDLLWIPPSDTRKQYERVLLMDLALRSRGGEPVLDRLPERMRIHLSGGGRVIVGRVFDVDREGRPWEQLAKLGWPRAKLQKLFDGFEHRAIATIDTVVFHELRLAPPSRGQ